MIYAIFICSLATHLCTRGSDVDYPTASACLKNLQTWAGYNDYRQDGKKYWIDKDTWAECEGKPSWEPVQ